MFLSLRRPLPAIMLFSMLSACGDESPPLVEMNVHVDQKPSEEHKPEVEGTATNSMEPRVVVPPNKKVRDENEEQPGVLTAQQLQGMLRTGRDSWQKPEEVLKYAGVEKGDIVADIGCGAGYWTFHLQDAVGESGKIFAVDFDANAIEYLKNNRLKSQPIENIETILSRSFDTLLPESSIDHAMLVDVHFFKQPNEPAGSQISEDFPRFYQSIKEALKPGGTLIILEHKESYASSRHVTQAQIEEQLKPIGFQIQHSSDMIDRQYFLIFSVEESK
jgi:predicted methyltransferase